MTSQEHAVTLLQFALRYLTEGGETQNSGYLRALINRIENPLDQPQGDSIKQRRAHTRRDGLAIAIEQYANRIAPEDIRAIFAIGCGTGIDSLIPELPENVLLLCEHVTGIN